MTTTSKAPSRSTQQRASMLLLPRKQQQQPWAQLSSSWKLTLLPTVSTTPRAP